jgi:hypothetical protein
LSFVPAFNAVDPINNNGTIPDDKTKGNDTLSNNSTVNISTEHYYSLNNGGNDWDIRYPKYNFSSSYYKDGISINKDGVVDYGGLLYAHDKANNRLVSEKDSFKSNVNSIVDIANKTFELYPETYFDSGSNSSFAHVPRAQLALMQENYRKLNNSVYDMHDYYDDDGLINGLLAGGEIAFLVGFEAIGGAISASQLAKELSEELADFLVGSNPASATGYYATKLTAKISTRTTITVICAITAILGVIGGGASVGISFDYSHQLDRSEELIMALNGTYDDLLNESVNATSINNKYLSYVDALHYDLNRTTNQTEKELVLQDYKIRGYTVTYLYNDTSVNVNISNNSTAEGLLNESVNKAMNKTVIMNNDIILNDTNNSNFFIRPSKVNQSANLLNYKPLFLSILIRLIMVYLNSLV